MYNIAYHCLVINSDQSHESYKHQHEYKVVNIRLKFTTQQIVRKQIHQETECLTT